MLGLIELSLSFLFIHAMLNAPGLSGLFVVASPTMAGGYTVLAALLALTVAVTGATIGLYRPSVFLDRKRLLINATVTGCLAFPAVLLVCNGLSFKIGAHEAAWFAKILGVWLVGVLAIRIAIGAALQHGGFARRILIVGPKDRAEVLAGLLRARAGRWFEPVVIDHPTAANLASLPAIWGTLLLGTQPAVTAVAATMRARAFPIGKLLDEASFHERYLGRIDLDAPVASRFFTPADWSGRTAKRLLDIAVSALLLFLTLPLMLVTALVIRLESPGSALYRQQRVGLAGKTFTLLKFRSMAADAEVGGKPCWAQKHDPRITRVGRFIRMTRIDELPQLLNVLRGDMSMIGPRPERPHFVEQLAQAIPFYEERARVKPGITGWAQVNYPYGASVEDAREKLAYDLYYVKNCSLFLDLMILAATVRVILFREGAR